MGLEIVLLWTALLIFVSVISSKVSDRFAVPVLLVFLFVGMLAGSEGIGRIYFDNAELAKSIGIVALIFIIFSGGLDTQWAHTKPVVVPGMLLATLGVLLTAAIVGLFACFILKFSFLQGMLLGAIVSSTDAAAVFSTLRSKRISLKSPLKPLLEFESGSNDPMAVFLTVGVISLLTVQGENPLVLIPRFFIDMGLGALVGLLMAGISVFLVKKLRLEYEGLYPVVMISLVLFTYATAYFLKGNGFLAVYLAGLKLGQADFPNKKTIMRFHDGLAWLMQIVMFVTFGLLVFPSHIVPLIGPGVLITLLLMLVARPLSVFLCLWPFKLSLPAKVMTAWVGLKGSAPIILATFPFMAGIPQADTIFNVVFFVVLASVFIQGGTLQLVAKALKLDEPMAARVTYPIEFEKTESMDADLTDVIVPYGARIEGKKIRELDIPEKCLIVLVSREGRFLVPSGAMAIQGGDVLLVLANKNDLAAFQKAVSQIEKNPHKEV